MFIIYINDLSNASNLLKTFLFADDTSLFYSHKDPNQPIHVMSCELSKISEWLKINKLSLNVAKTNYILFRPRQKPITVSDTITLDNITVQQVEVTNVLGVLLDQHLPWKYHHVTKKVSKTIGIISKARFFLSSKSLLSLSKTLVYPYLNYRNIAWCSRYPSYLNRILNLQKRIVRIICGTEFLAHTAPLFRTLKIREIFNINAFFVACFMYSYHNNLLPHTFNTTFVTNRQVHTYNTRNANNYRHDFCKTNIKQFTILQLGPKLWNSLPHNFTELTSQSSFKTLLKNYLIERAID